MTFGTSLKSRTPAALVYYLMSVLDKSKKTEWCMVQSRKKESRKNALQPDSHGITLPNRITREHQYNLGKVSRSGENLQLLMKLEAEMVNGERQAIRVLIDTGAQANLIRRGLLEEHLMYAARTPLTLTTANGQRLEGEVV